MTDEVEIVGPDNCPWHYRDPHDEVQIHDQHGLRVGVALAEEACQSWHVNAAINRWLAHWQRTGEVSGGTAPDWAVRRRR